MAYTQADIDSIDRRIATARKRVENGDQAITEYDISQLVQAREHMVRVVTGATLASRTMRSYARFRRS